MRALAAPRDDWLSVAEGRSRLLPPSPWDTPRLASRKAGLALPQISERRMNRRVPSVYHGLSGTKRERPISKGFLHCGMVHSFNENRTRISLKSLAIPAGFEPATHGVEIRYSIRLASRVDIRLGQKREGGGGGPKQPLRPDRERYIPRTRC